jgi:hypothetical protein
VVWETNGYSGVTVVSQWRRSGACGPLIYFEALLSLSSHSLWLLCLCPSLQSHFLSYPMCAFLTPYLSFLVPPPLTSPLSVQTLTQRDLMSSLTAKSLSGDMEAHNKRSGDQQRENDLLRMDKMYVILTVRRCLYEFYGGVSIR